MIHRHKIAGAVAGAVLCAFAAPTVADQPVFLGSVRISTDMDGYQEAPSTINTPASGEFVARIRQDGSAIDYTLTYRNLVNVTQAHIHFGRPATTGGIVLWLCNQTASPPATIPVPPTCQSDAAATGSTITGTLTAADMVAAPNQGVTADAVGFTDVIDAIRAGAAYANVHSTTRPSGEIRGNLNTIGRGHGHHH